MKNHQIHIDNLFECSDIINTCIYFPRWYLCALKDTLCIWSICGWLVYFTLSCHRQINPGDFSIQYKYRQCRQLKQHNSVHSTLPKQSLYGRELGRKHKQVGIGGWFFFQNVPKRLQCASECMAVYVIQTSWTFSLWTWRWVVYQAVYGLHRRPSLWRGAADRLPGTIQAKERIAMGIDDLR